MPLGRPSVPDEDIAVIERWMDDGCQVGDTSARPFTWRRTTAVERVRHDDVFFVDPELGWAVNSDGHILRTDDGGRTWQVQATISAYLRCVGFASATHGWVGTLSPTKRLFATTDGGTTGIDLSIALPDVLTERSLCCGRRLLTCGNGRRRTSADPHQPPWQCGPVPPARSRVGVRMRNSPSSFSRRVPMGSCVSRSPVRRSGPVRGCPFPTAAPSVPPAGSSSRGCRPQPVDDCGGRTIRGWSRGASGVERG